MTGSELASGWPVIAGLVVLFVFGAANLIRLLRARPIPLAPTLLTVFALVATTGILVACMTP